jgi:hypothetical protein
MPDNRTDLLPRERRKALAQNYKMRLAVVVLIFATILSLVTILLSIPAYVLLAGSAASKEAQLTKLNATASSSAATLPARLALLGHVSEELAASAKAPSASVLIRSVLAIGRSGIALSALSYTPAKDKSPGTLAVTGTAATRESLRAYQIALQGAPFALSADLPVSAFAKDNDILFTVNVTLHP